MDKFFLLESILGFHVGFPFYSLFEDFANEKQDELMSPTKVQNEAQWGTS